MGGELWQPDSERRRAVRVAQTTILREHVAQFMIEYLKRSDVWDDPDTPTEDALEAVVCTTDQGACAIWDSEAGTETHVVSTIHTDLETKR